MPRAGRPVNRLVSAVWRVASLLSAARCTALVVASGQSRYDVPICAPAAPSAMAAATPRASAMPPAAITGTFTARTICGKSANVPTCVVRSSVRKTTAMTAGLDALRDDRIDAAGFEPARLLDRGGRARAPSHRAPSRGRAAVGSGRPKWKLTTAGLNSSSTSQASALNGRRPGPAAIAAGSMSYSRKYGASAARHAASRSLLGVGGVWQKKLMPYGLSVPRLIAVSSLRIASGASIAHGREPRPPALLTAMASALPCTPAIGAWMTGSSIPRSCCSVAGMVEW